MRSLIFICALLANSAFGCDKNVEHLLEGALAPCDGYLFSPEAELSARKDRTDLMARNYELGVQKKITEVYKNKYEVLLTLADVENKKAEVWRKVAEENTVTLIKMERGSQYKDWIIFAGGVLTTVAAGYAIGQAGK